MNQFKGALSFILLIVITKLLKMELNYQALMVWIGYSVMYELADIRKAMTKEE